MTEVIEHSGSRAAGYATVAVLAAVVWWRGRGNEGAWSSFWMLMFGLLAVMAFARLSDVGDLVTDIGRDRARDAGWYGSRRVVQATVMVLGAALGAVAAALVIARAPQRWNRFVPVSLAVTALLVFVVVRLVSLRHVDDVIHGRHVGGVRVGTLVEYVLLVVTGVMVALHLRGGSSVARR
jgi:hypothetical protein